MFEEYKYKTELHCHSYPASPCGNFPAEEVVLKYKEQGFDAIVLTNHFFKNDFWLENKEKYFEQWINDYNIALAEGEKCGLKVYLGMEMRFSDINNNDFLVYGIDENDVKKAMDFFESNIVEFYKNFKNDKNVIVQAHPFRDGVQVVPPEVVDGYEVFNMHPNHNQRTAFAAKYAKKYGGIITGGTDFHHEGHQGCIAMITKKLPENSFELADILKKKEYLFDLQGCIIVP